MEGAGVEARDGAGGADSAYFVAATLGCVGVWNPSATAVWPRNRDRLAAFLILGYDVWPAILIGASGQRHGRRTLRYFGRKSAGEHARGSPRRYS